MSILQDIYKIVSEKDFIISNDEDYTDWLPGEKECLTGLESKLSEKLDSGRFKDNHDKDNNNCRYYSYWVDVRSSDVIAVQFIQGSLGAGICRMYLPIESFLSDDGDEKLQMTIYEINKTAHMCMNK